MFNNKFWKQFAMALVLFLLGYWTTEILFSGKSNQPTPPISPSK